MWPGRILSSMASPLRFARGAQNSVLGPGRLTRAVRLRSAGPAALALVCGCASLGLESGVRAPEVSSAEGRDPTLRIRLPGAGSPGGGAAVRLWVRVENPNAFSLTLSRLAGDLFLGDAEGVGVEFPLGVPLVARGDTVVPLDVTLDLDALPGLAETAFAALGSGELPYRLDATIGVDAGLLGQPTFGPTTLLRGSLRIVRAPAGGQGSPRSNP